MLTDRDFLILNVLITQYGDTEDHAALTRIKTGLEEAIEAFSKLKAEIATIANELNSLDMPAFDYDYHKPLIEKLQQLSIIA